jgi:SAM-dependent methyltransferase
MTTSSTDGGVEAVDEEAADRLLDAVLRRRKWALHRHVHLQAAFDAAAACQPIRSVLAVGCGAGLSEMYLAACHPDVEFTLTDFDSSRVEVAQRTAKDFQLANVGFRRLNLLAPPSSERYDLVVSIEVLEHIGRDQQAASHMVAVADKFVWALVPSASEGDLVDPTRLRGAWRRNEHVRPGYTGRTLRTLFEEGRLTWMRNCYFNPGALFLRNLLDQASDEQIFESRQSILDAAAADVRDELLEDDTVGGIEILVEV